MSLLGLLRALREQIARPNINSRREAGPPVGRHGHMGRRVRHREAAHGGQPQLLGDIPVIHYSTAPPVRTDAGQDAAPTLRLKAQVPEPPGPKMFPRGDEGYAHRQRRLGLQGVSPHL